MQRVFVSIALLLSALTSAQAQTTIKITNPDSTTCTYPTGQVSSNATPGQLQAVATGAGVGTGCGSTGGSVSFGPASPLAPSTQSIGNAGGTAALSFQAVNATGQCTGTISGASGGIFTGGTSTATFCTGAACANAQNFSMTFLANTSGADIANTVTATCTGTGTPAVSTATVTVLHTIPPGTCAIIPGTGSVSSFTQWTGSQSVNYGGQGNKSVDVTNFSSIYSSAWPGNFGVIATFTLPTNRYVSAAFSVPANYMTASNVPNPMYGLYQIGETSAVAPTSMSISTKCGDFSNPATNANSSVVPGCWLNNGAADYFVRWSNTGSCTLANNQAYFLNIITANISNVLPLTGNNAGGTATSSATARCSSACTVPIQNGPGTWQGYVPN